MNELPNPAGSQNLFLDIPSDRSLIVHGDALDALRMLPAESVQCAITSPPYWGMRDYSYSNQLGLEESLAEYINGLVTIFSELYRVLRNDGIFWLNIGDGYTSGNRKWRAPDKKNRARAMSVRPDTPEGLKPKDLLGLPWRLALRLQESGWYLRSDIVWNKPNAMPESVKDRPTKSHEYLFMLTKSEKYYYDRTAILEENGRNRRSVWNVHTQAYNGSHFATFPEKLVEPCILSSSCEDELVLDPFLGSGTTGLVAERHHRRFVGIELHWEFVKLAVGRLSDRPREIVRIISGK